MLNIRVAGKPDAALIADLSRQTFYDTFHAQNTAENMKKFLDEQFTRELLIREVGAPDNIFLLAFDDDSPAGYVRMRENNIPPGLGTHHAIEIARIYVVKSHIGRGIGARLMQRCLDMAKELGYNTLWLGVWEHNQTALAFYHKWGFTKFSEADFILGDDVQKDWLLKKEI